MSASFTRRRFVQWSGRAGAGLAAASLLRESLLPAAEARGPKLLVTVRDAMLKHVGAADCWAAMKQIGVEGVEAVIGDDLTLPGLFHPTAKYTAATSAGAGQLAADAAAAGQKITAFCMFNRYEERPEFEIEWGARAAAAAQALGVPTIRIDVVPRKLARPEFLQHAIATLKKLMAATEATGVTFAIENHGNTSNDPEFLTALFEGVGSRRLGLTLDTGNFYWFGHPLSKLYELYERFAPRAFHTHCKSIGYPAEEREKQRPMGWRYGDFHGPITQGDIDFRRVVAILRKAGYANDLCIENESFRKATPAEAAEVLKKEVELLKGLREGGTP